MPIQDLPETIETPQLVLRRASSSLVEPYTEALASSLKDLVPWFKWAQLLARWGTPEDLAARTTAAELRFQLGEDPAYYLSPKGSDEIVGEISLWTEGWRFGVLTYSVWTRSGCHGRGYATEGSAALFGVAFQRLQADAVEAGCNFQNHKSRRLLTKLGFEPWGTMGDMERYVLAPEGALPPKR